MTKKVLFILTIIVAAVLISWSAFKLSVPSVDEIQNSAHQYVDTNLPQILSAWNADELIKRASPGLLKVATKEQIIALFKTLSEKLGAFKQYKSSTGSTTITPSLASIMITGSYIAAVEFEQAPAEVLCRLVQVNKQWKIEEFRVNSAALVQ